VSVSQVTNAIDPFDERAIRQREAQRLGRRHGKLGRAFRVADGDFLGRQRALEHANLLQRPLHAIELVIVLIRADNHRAGRRIPDGAGLNGAFTGEAAIDEDPLHLAIVSADDVMPAARREGGVGAEIGQPSGRLSGDGKREAIMAIAEQHAAFEVAVVLERAEDAAPFLGLIHAHPRFQGQLLFGRRNLVDGLGDEQPFVASGQLDAAGRRFFREPKDTRRRDVRPAVPGFDRSALLTIRAERPPTDETWLLRGNGSGHQARRQNESGAEAFHGRTSFPPDAGASEATASGARRQ
jgi:hypothetical protein